MIAGDASEPKPAQAAQNMPPIALSRRQALTLGSLAALAAFTAGCATQPEATGPPKVARSTFDPKDKRIATYGRSLLTVATDLLRTNSGVGGNFAVSPYSLSQAIAVLAQGADKTTLLQLLAASHSGMGAADLAYASNAFELQLPKLARTKVSVANTVFVAQNLQLKAAFTKSLAENFGSSIQRSDFADVEGAAAAMNSWISNASNERLTRLMYEADLSVNTRLALVNGAYLIASWKQQFDPSMTAPARFNVGAKKKVEVDFMHASLSAEYVRAADCEVLALPYQDGPMRAYVLMPPLGSLEKFLAALTSKRLGVLLTKRKEVKVDVSLPRFQARQRLDLSTVLPKVGVKDAFDALAADFTNLTAKELHLNAAKHQAWIRVGERGTELVESNPGTTKPTKTGTAVSINRPFVFLVQQADTRSVLFASVIRDPSQDAPQ